MIRPRFLLHVVTMADNCLLPRPSSPRGGDDDPETALPVPWHEPTPDAANVANLGPPPLPPTLGASTDYGYLTSSSSSGLGAFGTPYQDLTNSLYDDQCQWVETEHQASAAPLSTLQNELLAQERRDGGGRGNPGAEPPLSSSATESEVECMEEVQRGVSFSAERVAQSAVAAIERHVGGSGGADTNTLTIQLNDGLAEEGVRGEIDAASQEAASSPDSGKLQPDEPEPACYDPCHCCDREFGEPHPVVFPGRPESPDSVSSRGTHFPPGYTPEDARSGGASKLGSDDSERLPEGMDPPSATDGTAVVLVDVSPNVNEKRPVSPEREADRGGGGSGGDGLSVSELSPELGLSPAGRDRSMSDAGVYKGNVECLSWADTDENRVEGRRGRIWDRHKSGKMGRRVRESPRRAAAAASGEAG